MATVMKRVSRFFIELLDLIISQFGHTFPSLGLACKPRHHAREKPGDEVTFQLVYVWCFVAPPFLQLFFPDQENHGTKVSLQTLLFVLVDSSVSLLCPLNVLN